MRATRFAIVGKEAQITFRVDDFGGRPGGNAEVALRIDGQDTGKRTVPVGQDTTISVPVAHGGENVVELEAAAGPAELTLQNNRAVVMVNGVRDRLRVLLVSGEPHAGERVWRNLLKADPSVDLVHFTILRPPDKQDTTPINELALIPFPTRQLFAEKLRRLRSGDLRPLSEPRHPAARLFREHRAICREWRRAAALVGAGIRRRHQHLPHAAGRRAAGAADRRGREPARSSRLITKAGFAHPVTRDLPQGNLEAAPDGSRRAARSAPHPAHVRPRRTPAPAATPPKRRTPNWGRWFRVIAARDALRQHGDGRAPATGRCWCSTGCRKGRVAELLSDQIWLWARGYENGGPQAELLRRLAHWLMKEPELEEERLMAEVAGGELRVTRQTMADKALEVKVTTPDRQGARPCR